MSERQMVFQVSSTEAALICTAKISGVHYSPDVFDDISTRCKKVFLDILPQVMDGNDLADIKTGETDVDIDEFGSDLL
jgi:hypothetical protein